jgi:uncharacterized protein YxjI
MSLKSDLSKHDYFYMNYKSVPAGNKYYIYDKHGKKIVYVQRPEKKGVQNIGIFTLVDKTLKRVYSLKTKKPVPVDEYFLYDEKNNLVAIYKKSGLSSILRSVWYVDANCRVVENAWFRSIIKACVKKETFIESDFTIIMNNLKIGSFIRSKKFGNRNILDLSLDYDNSMDRVTALGLAIVMDMIQQ